MKKWNKISKNNIIIKMKSKSKPKHQNKTINDILHERIERPKTIVDINIVNRCLYFRDKICTYFNNTCNPYSIKYNNPDILLGKNKTSGSNDNQQSYKNSKTKTHISNKPHYVKAIVLSHNKKCIYEEHKLANIKTVIRVLTQNNKMIDVVVPSVHCKVCNQYIILKRDFKSIKQKGTSLCRVIDET